MAPELHRTGATTAQVISGHPLATIPLQDFTITFTTGIDVADVMSRAETVLAGVSPTQTPRTIGGQDLAAISITCGQAIASSLNYFVWSPVHL